MTPTTSVALVPGQFVTAAGFRRAFDLMTCRSRGFDEARTLANGHDIAWTVNAGTALTDSPEYNRRRLAEEAAQLASAVTLTNGQTVEIEGRTFRVKINGERYADPIAFKLQADA